MDSSVTLLNPLNDEIGCQSVEERLLDVANDVVLRCFSRFALYVDLLTSAD